MNGLALQWTYDTGLRRDSLSAKNGATVLQSAGLQYDLASRLAKVFEGGVAATDAYHPNSLLISTLGLTNGPGTGQGLALTRSYDAIDRLTNIVSRPYGTLAPGLPVSFTNQYNSANQRTRTTLADASYWVYQYDALGQVTSGTRYWSDNNNTPVNGQQFTYAFDDSGNRDGTGGRAAAVADYTANRRNQYTGKTNAGVIEVLGLANTAYTVTVNNNTAARQAEYFHHPLSVPNATAQYPAVTVSGGTFSETGHVFVPPATETFGYDPDGNLTSDGRWTYVWDGENRLVEMRRDTSTPSINARLRLGFEYDHQGRRIRKTFYTHNGSSWALKQDTICLYDGWNLVAELDARTANTPLRTYVWGSDLSGRLQGAGGVGGLLWVKNQQATLDNKPLPTGVQWVAYDGNGNVLALVKAADGGVSARYEYGPFGEVIRANGPLARANPFRFSTKYTDNESGLLYYGYRFYNPVTGRWLSRDPIGEQGGNNLFSFLQNDGVNQRDLFGLRGCCGEDVTSAVKSTLANIETTYNWTWSLAQKELACDYLYGDSASSAWDILPLATFTPYFNPKTKAFAGGSRPNCEYTLTFNGSCYYASQINYAMWGRINKLCNATFPRRYIWIPIAGLIPGGGKIREIPLELWSYPMAVLAVYGHKFLNRDPRELPWNDYVRQAVGFTGYGYRGNSNITPNLNSSCRPSQMSCGYSQLDWTWEPLRHRPKD